MTTYDLPTRQARYFALSSEIAYLDNAHLRTLFDTTATTRGWGRNHVIVLPYLEHKRISPNTAEGTWA